MGQCPSVDFLKIRLFLIIAVIAIITEPVSGQGMKCSGYCTKDTMKCQLRGGKIIGYCNKALMCCDPLVSATGSCGDRKSGQKVVFFKSPNYPDYAGGDLLCELKVRIRNDTVAIRIDFLQIDMDGLSFDGAGDRSGACESDMIFIRGFQTWTPPPRCGNLTGYGVLIDLDTKLTRNLGMLSVVALMSSLKYRFHMRITQSTKNPKAAWDVKESFIAKRSVTFNEAPTSSPGPTKILIKTEKPFVTQTEGPANVETFRMFDSKLPVWKTPSIINGEDTVISTVPWQVSLRRKPVPQLITSRFPEATTTENYETGPYMTETSAESNCSESEGTHFCGGAILGDGRQILTAAHCFFGQNKMDGGMENISSIMVVVGDTNKCTDDEIFDDQDTRLKSYRYGVESVIFHYGYDHDLLMNDLAIVRLNESIKYYDHVKPIALANKGDTFEGQETLLSGWGDRYDEDDNSTMSIVEQEGPSILQMSKLLQIQNQSFCISRELSQLAGPKESVVAHPKYTHIFDSTICTLTKSGSTMEVNTGRGDSGGPLVAFLNRSQPVLAGIVSYSIPFDERILQFDGVNRSVDFFVSVAFYRGWIDLTMKSLQEVAFTT